MKMNWRKLLYTRTYLPVGSFSTKSAPASEGSIAEYIPLFDAKTNPALSLVTGIILAELKTNKEEQKK